MREAIEKRVSRRNFTGEQLGASQVETIQKMVAAANEKSGLSIEFVEDGSIAFSNVRTTYGIFSKVQAMLLMKGKADMADFREKIGYYGESLLLDIVDMGLGTCWVGGTFDRDAFAHAEGEAIPDVILIGNIGKPGLKDRLMMQVNHRNRKPTEVRITSDEPMPDWIKSGMEAVIAAPSAMNKQKPLFAYSEGILTATVPNDYRADLTDLGIAKLHFEIGANNGGHFEFGNGKPYLM